MLLHSSDFQDLNQRSFLRVICVFSKCLFRLTFLSSKKPAEVNTGFPRYFVVRLFAGSLDRRVFICDFIYCGVTLIFYGVSCYYSSFKVGIIFVEGDFCFTKKKYIYIYDAVNIIASCPQNMFWVWYFTHNVVQMCCLVRECPKKKTWELEPSVSGSTRNSWRTSCSR